jgi:hypothetical protein
MVKKRMKTIDDYYVYVYIDPRNYEEFYYGKGKGDRKNAHLDDTSDTEKVKRIADIKKAGLEPIIRVIARGLKEDEALLVEKTLLWKLGKWTTNIASGSFKNKFRPHYAFHEEIKGFDFRNGIYYYNIGEGPNRNWDDYYKYGFISAGQGHWRDAMLGFNPGDIVVAYLKWHGFVGIGRILTKAKMIREVIIRGKPLLSLPLKCKNMDDHCDDPLRSEYVCKVKWLRKVQREVAKWQPNAGLYTTTHVRASLENQNNTLKFLQRKFKVLFKGVV